MTRTEIITGAAVVLGLVVLFWLGRSWLRRRGRRRASPQDAYTQALSSLIGGDRRAALHHLKEAVHGDSENLDAYLRLGDLLRESGESRKALTIHRDLTVRGHVGERDRIRILESLTRDYLASARYEEAGQSAERIRRIDRRNQFAHRALQQVAEALRDWPRAIRVVEERAEAEGQPDKALLARYRGYVGEEELQAGNTSEARTHFEEALRLDPGCLLAALHLGDLEQAEGNIEKALELWRDLALRAPEHGVLVFDRLERAFFELGHFEDVVLFYRELLQRSPRDASVPALLAMAEIHRRKGDLGEADTFIQEALEIMPDNPRAYRHLVKVALDRKDPQAALSELDRLLQSLRDEGSAGECSHCGKTLELPVLRCPDCRSLNPLGL